MATTDCKLCGKPVDQHAEDTAKEVIGWVIGRKKDSMSLRQDTGNYAHANCVHAARMGIPPEQMSIFDEPHSPHSMSEARPEEGFDF